MAHQWYLQHGGKQYGPLTSPQLKKLAADGKIQPGSPVRLGAEGKWTTAGRVQGLFPTVAQPAAAEAAESSATAGSVPPQPPLAPPMAQAAPSVPRAAPLAPVSAAQRTPTANPAQPALAGKLVGAIGLIFGIVALATFWLPLVDALLGWTGIVVGSLGVLLGIAGLVIAAMQGGAGLYLNVATASSSLVGLVLTVVLGVITGMFSSRPAPVAPSPAPIVQYSPAPAPIIEPEPAAEPEPPPEPVWTDAREAIEQPPIRARIAGLRVEQVRLESLDLTQMRRSKPQPMLHVRVSIENTSTGKIVNVPGWNGSSSALPSGVGDLLKGSELGSQLQAASATATLTDQAGNAFPQTPAVRLSAAQVDLSASPAVRPGDTVEKSLLFEPPLDSSEYLRLELPPAGFGGSEPLRFQISRDLFAPPDA